MIKFENVEIVGWRAAIRGMRNPMNSWDKSDSIICPGQNCDTCDFWRLDKSICSCNHLEGELVIGPNDHKLMMNLRKAGPDHRKFMRMIVVYVDITAPLYWWKEFDTYKVGTVSDSCSTMHKIHDKEFEFDDFSIENLITACNDDSMDALFLGNTRIGSDDAISTTLMTMNYYRKRFLETKDKKYWHQLIQLLPSSYNQRRTIMMSYEVLANIYKSRKNHKLDEWSEHDGVNTPLARIDNKIEADNGNLFSGVRYFGLCDWIKTLPYFELITGDDPEEYFNQCMNEPVCDSENNNVDGSISYDPVSSVDKNHNLMTSQIYANMNKRTDDNSNKTRSAVNETFF